MSNGKYLNLSVISPKETLFNDKADMVVVPGEAGELGILVDHAPLISPLKAGRLKIKKGGDTKYFEIDGGFVEVDENKVMALVWKG